MHLNLAIAARAGRRALAGLAALALAAALAACDRAPAIPEPAAGTAPAPSAAGKPAASTVTAGTVAGFPVTLETALGPAVIPAPPKRVVALGLGADDLVLSLGVVPVGVGRADWGGDSDHYWPWIRAAIEARGSLCPSASPSIPNWISRRSSRCGPTWCWPPSPASVPRPTRNCRGWCRSWAIRSSLS
ncbi:hypothetical protein [Achromobacter sp. CSND-B12]|uniref:hypothetical protein n=1 Tax=Achromobacter sp. CSND-B12 TaxID=3462570 RepID=UPI00406A8F94